MEASREGRRPEQVRHQRDDGHAGPAGRIERDLVYVLDQHIRGEVALDSPGRAAGTPGVAVPAADPLDADAVDRRRRGRAGPAAHHGAHCVSAGRESAEDLMQVYLGAACLGVLQVLPVEEEDPEGPGRGTAQDRTPRAFSTASSTALRKRGLPGLP